MSKQNQELTKSNHSLESQKEVDKNIYDRKIEELTKKAETSKDLKTTQLQVIKHLLMKSAACFMLESRGRK